MDSLPINNQSYLILRVQTESDGVDCPIPLRFTHFAKERIPENQPAVYNHYVLSLVFLAQWPLSSPGIGVQSIIIGKVRNSIRK
jgi:hypothetical protein